jgi:hypothetical protein
VSHRRDGPNRLSAAAGPVLRHHIGMAHALDRGDILDMLEEGVTSGRAVIVELRNNKRFTDRLKDVVTQDGEEWAIFAQHETIRVTDIHYCSRAEPVEPSYAGKR